VGQILEREHELAELSAAALQAKDGDGSVTLIMGEAGIGKSSLVGGIRAVLPAEGRLLVGYCDDLATPRVLGPLRDLIGSVGARLTEALESGDRSRVIDALRAELDWPGRPTVLVVEDVHWADEATIDVLKVLVRRISALPVLLVLTYRDDELTRYHPLQQLFGLTSATPRSRRLRLGRLSAQAVRRLSADSGLDPDEVFALTSGNPFFVAEVLASGDLGSVPPTVAEAVRARLDDLDGFSRDALEQLAVVPAAAERWLVDAVVPGGLASLAAAERRGVLTVNRNRIAFRHELARLAVADSMPAVRRVTCNRAVLAALLDRPDEVDLSRIVHHAAEAGDAAVVMRYGPVAAAEAVAAQSHREAVAHYLRVLEHQAAFPVRDQADLLERYAVECQTVGLTDLAVSAQTEAVGLRRVLGEPQALGLGLRWLSYMHAWSGAHPQAETCAMEAIAVLAATDDQQSHAMALSNLSQLHAVAGRCAEGIEVGLSAVAMARHIDDAGTLSHALNNVGASYWQMGDAQRGRLMLEESLTVALSARELNHACRAYTNIVFNLIGDFSLDEASRLLEQAIGLAEEADFLGGMRYMYVAQSMVDLARGAWGEAERNARWGIDADAPFIRCPALIVQGRLRVRRGDPGGAELLAQAWEIAQQLGDAQRIGPAASAIAEAAWLRGDLTALRPFLRTGYEHVRRVSHGYLAAELGYWMVLAGVPVPVPESGHPFALAAAGRWREAAEFWQRAGSPYEHAAALAQSPQTSDLLEALSILNAIGAEPLARQIRTRLKELGLTAIPRGPAPTTRDNIAGLTQQQAKVARLLVDGLTNAEIAGQLVLSVRTVESHVAAILAKLNVRTRRKAAIQLKALGLAARS
jgi:DNA-binding CsgD family transcriptional regulator